MRDLDHVLLYATFCQHVRCDEEKKGVSPDGKSVGRGSEVSLLSRTIYSLRSGNGVYV